MASISPFYHPPLHTLFPFRSFHRRGQCPDQAPEPAQQGRAGRLPERHLLHLPRKRGRSVGLEQCSGEHRDPGLRVRRGQKALGSGRTGLRTLKSALPGSGGMTGQQEINLPGIHWTDARRFFAFHAVSLMNYRIRHRTGSDRFCLHKPVIGPMRA